jgi:PadR family transcriptional regulator, regulatory protein PadR
MLKCSLPAQEAPKKGVDLGSLATAVYTDRRLDAATIPQLEKPDAQSATPWKAANSELVFAVDDQGNASVLEIHLTLALRKHYMDGPYMETKTSELEWKKVSAELLILSLVQARPRHGYEISKLIEHRSGGAVRFYVASLYPLLYRLERRGWIQGRWVEKSGQRRRRRYRLTRQGRKVLASQLRGWQVFVEAINRIAEVEHA